MDSLEAAERVLRNWIRRSPNNPNPWGTLAGILSFDNQFDSALAAARTVSALSPQVSQEWFKTHVSWRAGKYAVPDSTFRPMGESPITWGEGLKWLSISLRTQGRVQEALAPAQKLRATMKAPRKDAVPYLGLFEAQVWFDLGNPRRAAAIFDSISRAPLFQVAPQIARNLVWTQTLRATALAAAGDTALLQRIADSVEVWGRGTATAGTAGCIITSGGSSSRRGETWKGRPPSSVRRSSHPPEVTPAPTSSSAGFCCASAERVRRPRWPSRRCAVPLNRQAPMRLRRKWQNSQRQHGMRQGSGTARWCVTGRWHPFGRMPIPGFGPRVERARLRIAALSGQ